MSTHSEWKETGNVHLKSGDSEAAYTAYTQALDLLLKTAGGCDVDRRSSPNDGSPGAAGTQPVTATLTGETGAAGGTRMKLEARTDGGEVGAETDVLSSYDRALCTLYSNRAAASLKLSRYLLAASDATRAIDIDQNYVSEAKYTRGLMLPRSFRRDFNHTHIRTRALAHAQTGRQNKGARARTHT